MLKMKVQFFSPDMKNQLTRKDADAGKDGGEVGSRG